MHRPLLLALVHLFALPLMAAPVRELHARVNGVVCSFCMQGLEEIVTRQPAVEAMRVDMDNALLIVTIRAGGTVTHELLRTWVRDAGYEVAAILDSEHTTTDAAKQLAERLGAPLPSAPTSALFSVNEDGRAWARVTIAAQDVPAWATWLERRPSIQPPAPAAWRELDSPLRATVICGRPGYVAAEGRVMHISL